jgi:N6-adenosine-specific RNA methylase IME4
MPSKQLAKRNSAVIAPALTRDGRLRLNRGLTFEEWADLGAMLIHVEGQILWWLGQWWLYGERTYGEAAQQALPTGFALHTVQNAAWVASRFAESSPRGELTWSHHREVAALPAPLRDELLDRAATEGLTVREIGTLARRSRYDIKMGRVKRKAARLADLGRFPIILADPPWQFDHPIQAGDVASHYETMPLEDIMALASKIPAADDAMLFLWSPLSLLPDALDVLDAWGFVYKSNMAWVKPRPGLGNHVRGQHELVLVGMKGTFPKPPETSRPTSIFEGPLGAHSEKPEALYEALEAAYPGLPKVEMFARREREGWVSWGDQAP